MTTLFRPTLILVLTALSLSAQPYRGQRAERIAQVLHLTDAQKDSIKALRDKHRPDLLARRETARQARVSLRTALQDPATPEAQLRSLYDKASAARFEMMLARRAMTQDVQAVLTPEQRIKAAELRGAAQERMRERGHRARMAG